jgi:hypothetical protein
MSSADFGDFLGRSLALLADEQPRSHARLCTHMAGRAVRFEVDGRAVLVRFARGGARIERDGADPEATIARLDRTTILDLVDGVVSLPDAILADRFHLRAELDDVARFHEALLAYLRGALRCPGFPALMDAYRAGRPPPALPSDPDPTPSME